MPPKKPREPEEIEPEEIERVTVNKLRTLGDVSNADRREPSSMPIDPALAARARALLEEEFERALRMKETLAAEGAAGGAEKGRGVQRADDKLRGVIASLEGANRFALKMGLITPAEARELYALAMKKGLHDGGAR